ncbi:CPBP family glutamic-type intramembrane protease [Luteimonas viscosa]|nr:CPBP family glutamic-type intramembrane protease [Luteimonas viscosa]
MHAWIALPVIVVFLWLDHFHLDLFRQVAGGWTGTGRTLALAALGYLPHWLVVVGVAALLAGPRRAAWALGLHRPPVRGFVLALVLTLPMLAALAWHAPLTITVDTPHALLRQAVLPGFGEELLYRGFLFGLLFRFAGWGFLPAALGAALLFGGAHLYQGGDAAEAAGIFALTALGSLWFAWLYVEWENDLWVPVAFHVLMNAWWLLFPAADNALGPGWFVAIRLLVLALSIGVTVIMARRRGGLRIRGRDWLWGGERLRA